jgi:hypothetical protein
VKGHVQKSALFYCENIIQSRVPKISLLVKDIFYTEKASIFYRTLGEIPIEIGCFSSMFLVGTHYVFCTLYSEKSVKRFGNIWKTPFWVVSLQKNSIQMTEQEPRYPVGVQNFEELRKRNMVYVDKTALIYDLVDTSTYVFLSRPRRFGKSLLTSTLHYYFAGRKDLFMGLAMEKLEKDWIEYPVLHFDLSPAKRNNVFDLQKKLNDILDEQDQKMQVHTAGTPGDRLEKQIKQTFQKTGKQVVLLVDEYDAPVMHVLHNAELLPEVREVMRDFFEPLKACNQYLRFVFITGVSTFTQMGIFSALNNLRKITSNNRYATICGITEQELRDYFGQGICHLAKAENISEEEMLAKLKDKYDGYHFSKGLVDIYNPFSLLNAFVDTELGNYWFDSGTSSTLVDALKQYVGNFKLDLQAIDEGTYYSLDQFLSSLEDKAQIIPLLYQTGYLTIKGHKRINMSDYYQLGVPNAEVRIGLYKNLLPLYFAVEDKNSIANLANEASEGLVTGDIDKALNILRSALKSIPYEKGTKKRLKDKKETEGYYHQFFHFFFYLMYGDIRSEVRHSTGATDVEITTSKYIYVIEIKVDASPEVALKQIDDKEYAVPHMVGHRAVYKVGVNFSTKSRTLSDWRVVEAKGVTE